MSDACTTTRVAAVGVIPDDLPPTPVELKGLIKGSHSVPLPGGDFEHYEGALPWAEHTSLYDKQDEVAWLTSEIRRRDAAPASSDG